MAPGSPDRVLRSRPRGGPARVLLGHKFFFDFGGIERHLFDLRELLACKGHAVIDFAMADPRNEASPYAADFVSGVDFHAGGREAWRALGRMLYSFEARRRLGRLADRERPDVAHLLSFYHHLSPSILHALRRRSIPVVHKLADYKAVCPVYTLMSRGAPCERCAGGRVWQVAELRCRDGRLAASAALAVESALHRWVLRSHDLVDLFLTPSRFMRDKVRAMGLAGPVRVLPNFVALDRWQPAPLPADPALAYAGRLTREKGVRLLIRAISGLRVRLKIFGEGPERAFVEQALRAGAVENVELVGHVDGPRLRRELAECTALVLPAMWYENNPHAVLEAYALGRPVVATDIGGLPEIVIHGETGLLVPPGDATALREAIRLVMEDAALAERMGKRGRQLVEASHSPEVFYEGLVAAYRDVGVPADRAGAVSRWR
jgi:glycosyltransferase involved in cell wall biosynthesis